MQENSLLYQNGAIKTYLDGGLHYGTEPIHEHDQYLTTSAITANTTLWWRIQENFQPINTICLFPIGQNPSGTLTVSVTSPNKDILLWSISSNMNSGNIVGNAFILTYPDLSFEEGYYGKISTTAAMDALITSGIRIGKIRKYLPE